MADISCLPSQEKECGKGDIILSRRCRHFRQSFQRTSVAGAGCQEQQATVVVGVVQTFQGQPKLATTDGQFSELLPFGVALQRNKARPPHMSARETKRKP